MTCCSRPTPPATLGLIGPERVEWLRSLAAEHREPGLVVLHASPGDLWRTPTPDDDDSELRTIDEPCRAAVVVYGHIHRPYFRALPEFMVANSGSPGRLTTEIRAPRR